MDMKIVLKTIISVLQMRNIHAGSHVTDDIAVQAIDKVRENSLGRKET